MFDMQIPKKENELTVEEAALKYAKIEQEFAKTIEQAIKSGNSVRLNAMRERVKKSLKRGKFNPGQILRMMLNLESHGVDFKRWLQISDLSHSMHHRMLLELNAALNKDLYPDDNQFEVPSNVLDEYMSGGNI